MRILCKAVASALSIAILLLWLCNVASAQNNVTSGLRGIVTDPSGARIPGAKIQLRGPAGEQTQTTDANGQYTFPALAAGRYDINVTATHFKADQRRAFNINGATTLNVQLALEPQSQVVTVEENAGAAVSVEPDANASATVLGKNELEALSDDPDELARQLQALAGPGVGFAGGQIYTDGISGSPPPKSS